MLAGILLMLFGAGIIAGLVAAKQPMSPHSFRQIVMRPNGARRGLGMDYPIAVYEGLPRTSRAAFTLLGVVLFAGLVAENRLAPETAFVVDLLLSHASVAIGLFGGIWLRYRMTSK